MRLAALRVDVPRDSHSAERFSLRCAGGRATFPAAADAVAAMRADAEATAGGPELESHGGFGSTPGEAAAGAAAGGGRRCHETAAGAEGAATEVGHEEGGTESASACGMGRALPGEQAAFAEGENEMLRRL